jgi:acetyl-CoA carboxylase biotin carboxyl carrier protein
MLVRSRNRPKAARRSNGWSKSTMPTEVAAEIAGNVWKIETTVGAQVEEEEVLLILESMKMEIPVEAPRAGRVAEVRVAEGDSIEEGAVLVVLE